ncbi:hypothetical protein BS78_02G155600 [Paspalum vaginatum]|nr:hypothetical protein BS78_02G155600 [Paspalum vaginatum]
METVVDANGGSGGWLVVAELSHIKELVRQLEVHLGGPQSQELCKHLASQISSITERSISLITSFRLDWPAADVATTPSLLSDASDAPFKTTKKRKTMGNKRHQVRVSSAGGGDNPVDDGHSWRKYGQKEILGAKHPRGYYRCTHRHSQGCAATKQVQRTDDDPTLFDVVYLGEHTCAQRAAAGQAATGAQVPEHNQDANLTVKIEGLAVEPELQQGFLGTTTPFGLVSTPASGCLAQERGLFSVPSPSPATPDSNHVVPFPPIEVAGDEHFGFEEVMSASGEGVEDLDLYISSFLA